jgi:hypothetical protein
MSFHLAFFWNGCLNSETAVVGVCERVINLQSAEAPRVDVEDAQPLNTYPRAVQEHIRESLFTLKKTCPLPVAQNYILLSRNPNILSPGNTAISVGSLC